MKWLTKEEVFKEVFSYVKIIVGTVIVVNIILSKIVTQAQVPTASMENTIMQGSRVVLNRTAYWFEEPERGDIAAVYIADDPDTVYLKRIIGLPGEEIEGRDGKIYIDGIVLSETYIKEECYIDFGPYTVPEDSYFMMGDNRNNSWDARYWRVKFVEKSDIIGNVKIELYPELKILE